jgi:nucleotide-binding universal stress UspA family protein
MRRNPVIVGADGTDSSKAAVRWAAREAQRRGLPLRVVHVFDWEWREARFDASNHYLNLARQVAEGVAADAVFEARLEAPELEIESEPVLGHETAMLLAEAEHAELVVLGSRGRGGFGSLLLGSVSQRVATHAECPVVVVRGRVAVEGPVAAGVDDSPSAELVLQTAFEAAAARHAALLVIRSFLPAVPLWMAKAPTGDADTPAADADEQARLEEQLAPWRAKFPAVPVETVLTHQGAAAALVAASGRAQLVIAGSHGHGAIAGALLGSAGLQLLHHAECPVYICRQPVDPSR